MLCTTSFSSTTTLKSLPYDEMIMVKDDNIRIWRRRQRRRTKSLSLVVSAAAAAVVFVGVALLATCCQGAGDDSRVDGSSHRRRTRGDEGSLRGGGGSDINDKQFSSTTGLPKTFLIKFKDGLAQTRSLEIHRNSRRRRQQQQLQHPQRRRETRGKQSADGNGQTKDHNDSKKWQSRAKSISSISDERHIAIVEIMDPDNNQYGDDVVATSTATASEMYDELIADEDVELVEEVRVPLVNALIEEKITFFAQTVVYP